MKTTLVRGLSLIALAALMGCASEGPVGRVPVTQAININAISAVQAEIKRQVGVYLAAATRHSPRVKVGDKMVSIDAIAPPGGAFMCGAGRIGFDIASVKAELTTTTDSTADVKAGVTLPFEIVTLGPSGEGKHEALDTEVLDFTMWPIPASRRGQNPAVYDQVTDDAAIDGAPIARALLDLRDALVVSAMRYDLSSGTPHERKPFPCFTDYNPDKPSTDPGDTFKLGLTITNDVTGGITVKVAILNFGATGETKSTTGNTLTVSFIQTGVQKIQALKDIVDAKCKSTEQAPDGNTTACRVAKNNLEDAEANEGVGIK